MIMHIPDQTVRSLLVKAGKVTEAKITALADQAKTEKTSLEDIVVSSGASSELELTQLYADEVGVPFIELKAKEISIDVLKQIPEHIARLYNMVIFKGGAQDKEKQVAMEDPDDLQAIDVIHKLFGQSVKLFIATRLNILSVIDQYRGNISSEITKVMTEGDDPADGAIKEEDEIKEEDVAEDSAIAQTVNLLIEYAIKSGASDIHIEPREKYVSIRYRVDGVLKDANKLPKRTLGALVSRIKILSNLKIDERRSPQDGRFKITLNGRTFAFRVSTLPIAEGEKVVMRILDESSEPASLEELGFWGAALNTINDSISQPHGMVLVTGPTGSGKSTTLHSVLNLLNKPEVNISTIEDPVEYKLEGVNQTQVNPVAGMTFAAGLRALLRQDPNVIMVGEIRDAETAGLGVQAALTGHLVFSTLHTNNAATCLPRLLDMGIEPFLIASVVRVVIGQRLVRQLIPEDAEEYTPSDTEKKEIERVFGIKTEEQWQTIFKLLNVAQEAYGKPKTAKLSFWRPKKDLPVDKTGYKGRKGIYEVLDNSLEVQKMIVANATSEALQEQAVKEGMITMQLDGLIKALLGVTSIEEILRVTKE